MKDADADVAAVVVEEDMGEAERWRALLFVEVVDECTRRSGKERESVTLWHPCAALIISNVHWDAVSTQLKDKIIIF